MKGGILWAALSIWLVAASSVAADSATFTHDANGNLTSRTEGGVEWTYGYDSRDQLREVLRDGTLFEVYQYDAQGRRVRKTSADGVVRYVWDGSRIVQETDDFGNTIATYEYAGDRLVSVDHVTEGTGFYVLDALGSPVGLVRADGILAARYHLDAWGVLRAEEGDSPNPFRFTGHQFDEATGLYYAKARYYDPSIGRFLSEDPVAGNVGTPASLHRYLYASGNPTTYVDPTGQIAVLRELKDLLKGASEEAPRARTGPFTGQIDRMSIRATNKALLGLGAKAVGLANLGVNAVIARQAPTSRLGVEAQTELLELGQTIQTTVQAAAQLIAESPIGPTVRRVVTLPSNAALRAIDTANRLPYMSEREVTELVASGIEAGIEGYAGGGLASRLGRASALVEASATTSAEAGLARAAANAPAPRLSILNPEFTPDPRAVLQSITAAQNDILASDPAIARRVLSVAEYAAGTHEPWVAAANYGKAVERLAAREIRSSPLHRSLFEHVGGPYQPDFVGRSGSIAEGLNFDITTPGQVGSHLRRPGYGLGLNVVTYDRPRTFRLFTEVNQGARLPRQGVP